MVMRTTGFVACVWTVLLRRPAPLIVVQWWLTDPQAFADHALARPPRSHLNARNRIVQQRHASSHGLQEPCAQHLRCTDSLALGLRRAKSSCRAEKSSAGDA